jgi:lipopolysaccharide export system permease protein
MILVRYILRAHIAPFVFGTSVIMSLFLIQYIMRWVDQLASKGLDLATIGEFLALNLSWIVVLAVPIGALFSTVMAFGGMSAAHETTVMKSSGMGLFRMMMPVVIASLGLWAFTFWYTDNVLPDTNLRLSGIMRDIKRAKPTFAVESGQFTTHIEGYTILARNVDTSGLMTGVTLYDGSRVDRKTIVSADTGRMSFSPSLTRLVVQLYHGEIHQSVTQQPNDYRVITFERHQIVLPADQLFFQSTDVSGSSRSDREMSIADMQIIVDRAQTEERRVQREFDSLLTVQRNMLVKPARVDSSSLDSERKRIQQALLGISSIRSNLESLAFRRESEHVIASTYLVEIYKKYAIPFACVIFVLVGAPLGMIVKGGSFGTSALISLGFYILYWISLIGGEKLADRNILDPGIAIWSGNILIGAIGIVVAYKVNYEVSPSAALRQWLSARRTA